MILFNHHQNIYSQHNYPLIGNFETILNSQELIEKKIPYRAKDYKNFAHNLNLLSDL